MGGPVHVGFDPGTGRDRACIVVLKDGCVIRRALWIDPHPLLTTFTRYLARAEALAHFGKSRLPGLLEASLREFVVKPLVRAIAPQPQLVCYSLIRTGNASYPAWVLQ